MKYRLTLQNRNITDAEILADLRSVVKITGKDHLPISDYKLHGKYAQNTVIRHFGGWNRAKQLAGIRITVHNGVTKTELFQNLRRVWLTLGRQPMRKEMKAPLSEFSWRTYRDVFGSFRNALEEFLGWANRRRKHKVKTPILDIAKARGNHRTRKSVKPGLRLKVFERDGYKCVICGSSPAYGNGTLLHVDHIVPYSKGGETVIDNLQTLCKECNLGKGNR